jgi:hypothetical protein
MLTLFTHQKKSLVRENRFPFISIYEYTASSSRPDYPMHACKPSQYIYVYKTPYLKPPPSLPFSASKTN